MARVGKPPRQQFLGHLREVTPPTPDQAPNNFQEKPAAALKDLNFKVDPTFHQRFKMEAAARGVSMVELLKAAFWQYVQQSKPREE